MLAAILTIGLVVSAVPDEPPARDQNPAPATVRDDPYDRRPVCESMFLSSEWQLTPKQNACDWIQNRVLSTSALAGAAFSATTSPLWANITGVNHDQESGFMHRFAIDFGQNAFKSTGAYLGGRIFHEDPRVAPPYLIMRPEPRPHGFWRRTGHALQANVMSYRCDDHCRQPDDIKRTPALSKVTGSLANGVAMIALEPNAPDMKARVLRGAVSAYAATFANSLFVEFKPELSAFAGRVFTMLGIR
jgi:hypothetical protein